MAKKRQTSATRRGTPRARRQEERPGEGNVFADQIIEPVERARSPSLYTIVGIGASAGGVEALSKLLERLQPDTGLAYVLVQHLAPTHESLLAEVLSPLARIPVVQAEEQMEIRPNRLHVIPPNVHMTIDDGHLHLGPRPHDRTQYNPIDSFFQSLSTHAEHRAIGVVLSGSASDGAAGLREINAAGGLVIAQDPSTARYDGMPRAAIATGVVDLILPPDAIGEELSRLGTHPFLGAGREPELALSESQLERIFSLLRASSNVDFTQYRLPTIKRRLQRRMALHKLTDAGRYLHLLEAEPAEVRSLYRDILIHVTRFFRDPESFAALKTLVFPAMVADASARRPIRIWVPGCATGEEAYSLAIALLEHLGDEAPSVPMQVFATDVSEEAIERARAGLYPESINVDVSPERLRRFFTRVDGHYRISKVVRDACVFARQDLIRDPPFSKLDLIVCRNVLIYLGPRLQQKLMSVFHYALKPKGFLMLGSTETVGTSIEFFSVRDKRHKIYARGGEGRAEPDIPSTLDAHFGRAASIRAVVPAARPLPRPGGDLQTEVTRLLLARYSPPSVLVDNELQIVQTRGKTGPYLELASGEASLSLLKMAREGLLHGLRAAIQDARKHGKPVRRNALTVTINGTAREVDIQVVPFRDSHQAQFFLVSFEDTRERTAPARAARPRAGRKQPREDAQSARLRQELTASREYLQSIIQDLEAANEELQSANEEILSSNEELQSTNEELDTAKEELQSTNEELNTVNEELNARNEELSHINSDLVNLLGAVPAAIVIVSSDLRIRRYTPPAEHILNLIPSDIGRPVGDIKPTLDVQDLEELAREAIETVTMKELEVQDRAGASYVLRVRPYRDQDNRIRGAVLAFSLLAQQKKADT